MQLVPIIELVQAALAAAPAVAPGTTEALASGVAATAASAPQTGVVVASTAPQTAATVATTAATTAPEVATTAPEVAATTATKAGSVTVETAASAGKATTEVAPSLIEKAPAIIEKTTDATISASSNITGLDVARYGLVLGSVGLGATQGVLAYQAGEEAKRAKEAQARAIQAAGERRIGQLRKEALRYENILRARAGAAGLGFEGSPAILGQEALGSVTAEAETIRSNAASAASMLRREGRAASLAGRIGLGTGIGSGLVNAGQIALRVYG